MTSADQPFDKATAAECRALEAGHRAILDRDERGPFIRVVSDTVHGKHYQVRALSPGTGLPVVLDCTPVGDVRDGHLHKSVANGVPWCMHMALACRRLSGARLVRFDHDRACWVGAERRRPAGARALEAARAAAEGPGGDPFAGFPS